MKKLLPLLIVMTFAGCKKDTVDLLTRSWKKVARTAKSDGVSYSENISLCSTSSGWTFRDDGSFLRESSPDCTPDGNPNFPFSGTWSLPDNETLRIDYGTGFLDWRIVTLTKSRLVLQTTSISGQGYRAGSGGLTPDEVELTDEFVPR